jgi:ABC-type transport system involved in multi-copper enzyme maturation permease subunit
LISVGAAGGLAVLAIAYGLIALVSPRFAAFVRMSVTEGILLPLTGLAVFLTAFAILTTPAVPFRELLAAVGRIPAVGDKTTEFTIPPVTEKGTIPLPFSPLEIQGFEITSDGPLDIITHVNKWSGRDGEVELKPGQTKKYEKPNPTDDVMLPDVTEWTVTNLTDKDVHLTMAYRVDIRYPEVRLVPAVSLGLIALYVLYLAISLAFPKVAAIAATTSKESMGQPLFPVALVLGMCAILLFIFIPYNTFGEDVKMFKDSGLTSVMLLAILVAVWSASVSVADEIEGRTALTLLSKPVRRHQFILGKYLGILWPVLLLFVLLGVWLLFCIPYKVVYDARETAKLEPTWQMCYWEMITTLPGLLLAFFESVILASISVAISTKLPMLPNLIICTSIYVLGHLVPTLVNSSVGKFEIVQFVGQLIAIVLPVLDHLNIQASIAAGSKVPLDYLAWAAGYCALYSTIALLVALALFEDRDLA